MKLEIYFYDSKLLKVYLKVFGKWIKKDLHKGVKSACETGFDKTCGHWLIIGFEEKWNEDDTYSVCVNYNRN